MLSVFIIYLGRWSLGLKFQKVENPWALSQENLANSSTSCLLSTFFSVLRRDTKRTFRLCLFWAEHSRREKGRKRWNVSAGFSLHKQPELTRSKRKYVVSFSEKAAGIKWSSTGWGLIHLTPCCGSYTIRWLLCCLYVLNTECIYWIAEEGRNTEGDILDKQSYTRMWMKLVKSWYSQISGLIKWKIKISIIWWHKRCTH